MASLKGAENQDATGWFSDQPTDVTRLSSVQTCWLSITHIQTTIAPNMTVCVWESVCTCRGACVRGSNSKKFMVYWYSLVYWYLWCSQHVSLFPLQPSSLPLHLIYHPSLLWWRKVLFILWVSLYLVAWHWSKVVSGCGHIRMMLGGVFQRLLRSLFSYWTSELCLLLVLN